ncbi:MAG TPA: FtsX-like permease family protein, partial [Cyclobacteriaceae bacterium]|nr:FtsX-like permease family protein [Cyclobacteriaceae bacterium]
AVDKKIITSGQWEYRVVGVVKNFNYTSPRQKVGPLVMMLRGNRGAVLVKLNASDIGDFIENARTLWDKYNMNGDIPFSYTFLDEKFKALYTAEERTGKIFTSFATLAVIIAGLGLFGLSTYSAEQRTREIGIRKVLGASSRTVLLMLSRQFMLLVLLAFAIAVPLVLWAMNQWLNDFAYRVSIGWWIFVIAAGISCLIAFASMGIQAAKAATANPVKSLRN